MRSRRHRHAPDERGRGSTADAVALVRPLGVVVAHEAIEGALQSRAAREVASPEHHAPELLEDRALQPFDEAVGPGMARVVRVCRRRSARQATSKAPLNSGPPAVSTRRTDHIRGRMIIIYTLISRFFVSSYTP